MRTLGDAKVVRRARIAQTSATERGLQICEEITTAGVRATTDPSALNPPAVLVIPGARVYDLNCGYTLTWELYCVAPAPTGGDRTTWQLLDELLGALEGLYPLERADPRPYPRPGLSGFTSLPMYVATFEETP